MNPTTSPNSRLPDWAKEAIRWGIGILLVVLATRYGIKPPDLPPIAIQAADGSLIQAIPVK
jgi:hypothetical protein